MYQRLDPVIVCMSNLCESAEALKVQMMDTDEMFKEMQDEQKSLEAKLDDPNITVEDLFETLHKLEKKVNRVNRNLISKLGNLMEMI